MKNAQIARAVSSKSYPLNKTRYWLCHDVEAICRIYKIHPKTVHGWFEKGLKPIDNKKPMLIYGYDLKQFLGKVNESKKCSGSFETIFCMSCKEQKNPLQKQIIIEQFEQKFLRVKARCSGCKKPLNKSYPLDELQQLKRIFDVVQVLELYDSKTPTSKTPLFDQEKSSAKEHEEDSIQLDLFL